jgi:hypothetical protein
VLARMPSFFMNFYMRNRSDRRELANQNIEPSVRYHQAESPEKESEQKVNAAFDILFKLTSARIHKTSLDNEIQLTIP